MNNPLTADELIGAYLDGELSEAERARAEQLLVDDADRRRLYYELRTLHTALAALPRHRLPADFPAQVLRAAERAMLAGESGQQTTMLPTLKLSPSSRKSPGPGWWLIGTALATAAAVLVLVVTPAAVERQIARDAVTTAPSTPAEAEDYHKSQLSHQDTDADARFDDTKAIPAAPPMPSEPSDSLIGKKAGGFDLGAQVEESSSKSLTSETSRPDDVLTGGRQLRSLAEGESAVGETASKGMLERKAEGEARHPRPAGPAIENAPVMITCDVSREAIDNNAFEQLTTKHGIVWDVDEDRSRRSTGINGQVPSKSSTDDFQAALPTGELARQSADGPGTELIVVEANREQVTNLLADLQNNRQWFRSASVNPPPNSPEQDTLGKLSWDYADFDQDARKVRGVQPVEQELETIQLNAAKAPAPAVTSPAADSPSPSRLSGDKQVDSLRGLNRASTAANAPASEPQPQAVTVDSELSGRGQSQLPGVKPEGQRGRARRLGLPLESLAEQLDRGESPPRAAMPVRRGGEVGGAQFGGGSAPAVSRTDQADGFGVYADKKSGQHAQSQRARSEDQVRVLFILRPAEAAGAETPAKPAK